ncbi:MAG TPA: PH domain-containing protein [Mycobacteriales bacterium]|nr:PH domain-containing protein [Mycobacteriales bacterium]
MRVDHTPTRLRHICRVLAALVVVVFGVVTVLLPRGEDRVEAFGPLDQAAFFAIGLLIAGGVLVLTRFRVRADARGVWVRNSLGERYFPWAVVVGVHLPPGSTWAQLELHDDETVAILAVQTSDGDRAVDAVLALRGLLKDAQGA